MARDRVPIELRLEQAGRREQRDVGADDRQPAQAKIIAGQHRRRIAHDPHRIIGFVSYKADIAAPVIFDQGLAGRPANRIGAKWRDRLERRRPQTFGE